MCGRKTLIKNKNSIIEELNISDWDETINYIPSYNIAPTQKSLVLLGGKNKRQIKSMIWGLIPNWSKNKKSISKLINARSETLHEKPSFKYLIKSNRCIIVSDGYYEWNAINSKKQPYYIYDKQKNILPMAGLWSSSSLNDKEIVLSYTVITKKADKEISHIHDRMPLIIDFDHIDDWFNNDSLIELNSNSELIRKNQLNFHKVDSFVNSYRNNNQNCIHPIH
tara:strand:- start:23 stop:691 length:669 start_codon:yes stop_codon:yes gene_type:complete